MSRRPQRMESIAVQLRRTLSHLVREDQGKVGPESGRSVPTSSEQEERSAPDREAGLPVEGRKEENLENTRRNEGDVDAPSSHFDLQASSFWRLLSNFFKDFVLMWAICKVFIKCVIMPLLFSLSGRETRAALGPTQRSSVRRGAGGGVSASARRGVPCRRLCGLLCASSEEPLASRRRLVRARMCP